MNIILFYSNILILIFPLVSSSTTCSIFPSLNCSCFHSNVDLNSTLSMKIYSHLYCQGNSLTEKTFQSPFGSDFKHQNHFRTVSIEFFNKNHVEIQSNQFDSLSMLFSQTNHDAQIDIFLRFNGFNHITFQEYSLTSAMFQQKHRNKRLSVHLIPGRNNLTQIDMDEENSTNIEDQFRFSSNCFSGLIVSQMTFYIYTKRDRFPSSSSFEEIFNNTNIGELHFHGSIIPPSSSSLKQIFKGLVKSLTLHRHVDTIDSNTFPYYSHVYSYTIHSIKNYSLFTLSSVEYNCSPLLSIEPLWLSDYVARPVLPSLSNESYIRLYFDDDVIFDQSHEAYSMNLSSFLPSHTNLRGLEIIEPRFEVSINQLIPTLDLLTLDVEHLNEKTVLAARHIRHLKLGSRLRTINSEVLTFLSRRLNHLDLSDIDLSQMTTDSRCHLIKYLSKTSQQQLNIIYPRIENLTECDCTRLFINHIQFKLNNESTCSKLCILSDCQTISEYFKEKYPLIINENQLNDVFNETINDKNNTDKHFSSVDLYSDPIDVDMITFLINQTSEQERNETQRRPTITINTDLNNISAIENIQEYDDIIPFSTPKLFEPSDDHKTEFFHPDRNISFSWLSFFLGVGVILLLLIIISLVVFLIVQYRKEHNFKPVPVYV